MTCPNTPPMMPEELYIKVDLSLTNLKSDTNPRLTGREMVRGPHIGGLMRRIPEKIRDLIAISEARATKGGTGERKRDIAQCTPGWVLQRERRDGITTGISRDPAITTRANGEDFKK